MTPIPVQTVHVASKDPSLPDIAVQVTQLMDSYSIWAGATTVAAEDVRNAPLQGLLCKDWACAMPPRSPGAGGSATSLFRSSASDYSLAMAQRLAQRFKKQIFLSIDVPPSALSVGQGPQLLLSLEKAVLETLQSIEGLH